jgi:hypothetical protein
VANHCERVAGLRCAGPVLQPACVHVLLAFNGLPAARLVGAQRHPRHIVPWKIRACPPDGDHDGRVAKGYLFTLIARDLLIPPTGHVAAPELR